MRRVKVESTPFVWWRCPKCNFPMAEAYILSREDPYRCFMCRNKGTGWRRVEGGPDGPR